MSDEPRPFPVISGAKATAKPRAGKRRSLDEPEQVQCFVCEADIGIPTSAVVKVTVAPRRSPDGRKEGGTDIWACAHCLSRGKITELIRT